MAVRGQSLPPCELHHRGNERFSSFIITIIMNVLQVRGLDYLDGWSSSGWRDAEQDGNGTLFTADARRSGVKDEAAGHQDPGLGFSGLNL